MTPDDVDPILRETLADHRLSREERRSLKAFLKDYDPDQLAYVRHRAFALAREAFRDGDALEVLDWLEGTVKALVPAVDAGGARHCQVCFSPGDACLHALGLHIRQARESIDICVFTITDDRIAESLLEAHGRGVGLRIITDNEKSGDRGSDVERLQEAGIPVRMDRSEHHMHHKFAIFDDRHLCTGSYNWTRSAARHNRENLVFTDDPDLLRPYRTEFNRLWTALA